MRLLYILSILCIACFICNFLYAQPMDYTQPPLNVEEEDGSPSVFPYKLKVTNGTLTDNGDETASLTTGGGGGSGDITSVGNVTTGAAFDGTQGTILTFNNAGGDKTLGYDGTDFDFNAAVTIAGTLTADGLTVGNDENITFGTETLDFDSTANDFRLTDDLNLEDASPHLNFRDTDSNVAYMWHIDSAYAYPSQWDPFTLLRGTDDGTGFVADGNSAVIGFDSSGNTRVYNDLTVQGNAFSFDGNTVNLSDTTDEYVLAFDTATQTWRGVVASGGTSSLWLMPESSVLDDTVPPAITVVESTGTGTPRRRVADFDGTTDEIVYWSFTWQGYTTATVYWYSNDVGPNETCFWSAQISATTEADADTMAEDAGDTTNLASEDVNETEANRLIVTTITLTNIDSAATDDFVTLIFSRDANNASDDLTSDARLLGVLLE